MKLIKNKIGYCKSYTGWKKIKKLCDKALIQWAHVPSMASCGPTSGIANIFAIFTGDFLAPGYISLKNSFKYVWS